MAYDHSGKDRLGAKSFASVLIRGPLRMSFFPILGARNPRPYSKQLDQKMTNQSIEFLLLIELHCRVCMNREIRRLAQQGLVAQKPLNAGIAELNEVFRIDDAKSANFDERREFRIARAPCLAMLC
jgi:hypothetical protein